MSIRTNNKIDSVYSEWYISGSELYAINSDSIEIRADACNNSFEKRFFDFLFTLFLFTFIFSWLFPIIAILIKLTSKGPVYFIQERTGLNNEIIRVYKFRTMTHNAPHTDSKGKFMQAVKNDSRVTAIGKILRSTSLDELPQFWNVLKGDMSIVGPRPHVKHLDDHYEENVNGYTLRTLVRPGITGLAQASGLRGVIEHNNGMQERVDADIAYIRNWSLLLDMQIIFKTFTLVFKDENAF